MWREEVKERKRRWKKRDYEPTALAQELLLRCDPQAKTINQRNDTMKQKIATEITYAWGLAGSTNVDATRHNTRPPKT